MVMISLRVLLVLCSMTISDVDAATAQSQRRTTRETLPASHGRAQASAFADLVPTGPGRVPSPEDEFVYRPLVRFSTREWTSLQVKCVRSGGFYLYRAWTVPHAAGVARLYHPSIQPS